MMKRIKENNYKYKHPLGTIIVDCVEVGISKKGRRSLHASEMDRLNRLAVFDFLKKHYRKSIMDSDFKLSSKVVRAVMAFLKVNQVEFGYLVGCQKSKVSKVLRSEQAMSKSQSLLVLERLMLELERPGSTRKLLGDEEVDVKVADKNLMDQIDKMRFSSAA